MEKSYPITVDYSMTPIEMIEAGKYDNWLIYYSSKPDFSQLRDTGKVEFNIELVKYDEPMNSNVIIKDLERRGLRPATVSELLAFGAQYPEVQRDFPIIALGSAWRHGGGFIFNTRFVTSLDTDKRDNGRKISLEPWKGTWKTFCRFAAVREVRPFQNVQNDGDIIHGYPYPPKIFSKRVRRLKGERNGKNLSYHR